jgi:predicted Fe-Mo cluster-binding NifX family protein
MKIAVPTHDGLNIAPVCEQAKGTLVISIESGEIIQEEMRWNILQEISNIPDSFLCNASDCEAILVNHIGEGFTRLLSERGKTVYPVKEAIITNAFMHFMLEQVNRESNYVCCP